MAEPPDWNDNSKEDIAIDNGYSLEDEQEFDDNNLSSEEEETDDIPVDDYTGTLRPGSRLLVELLPLCCKQL